MPETPRNSVARAFARGLKQGGGGDQSTALSSVQGANKRNLWLGVVGLAALIAVSFAVQPSDRELAEEKAEGFHCLSGWDGSHEDLVAQVKKGLREPQSFEHVSTKVTGIKPDGTHGLIMQYRARNGLGGTVIENVAASYESSNCALIGWDGY